LAEEVISGVVSSSSFWDLAVGAWLEGVDEIWEKDRIIDEKYGDVDPNNVSKGQKVSFQDQMEAHRSCPHQYRT
jgi:hypothetical protein